MCFSSNSVVAAKLFGVCACIRDAFAFPLHSCEPEDMPTQSYSYSFRISFGRSSFEAPAWLIVVVVVHTIRRG